MLGLKSSGFPRFRSLVHCTEIAQPVHSSSAISFEKFQHSLSIQNTTKTYYIISGCHGLHSKLTSVLQTLLPNANVLQQLPITGAILSQISSYYFAKIGRMSSESKCRPNHNQLLLPELNKMFSKHNNHFCKYHPSITNHYCYIST